MDVIELLEQRRGLTDTQADVADYILTHVDDVTGMTIGELGKAAHCSASVIVQLCRRLGLDGYRQLRIELARQVERRRMQALDVILPLLRKKGVRCVVVTANRSLAERLMPSDCALVLPEGESRKNRLASFYSESCIRYLLSCVYAEAFSQDYQRNVEAWERLVQYDDISQE